ncbi:hypothetical protein WN51_11001 [Melipona quadrifasciata]|uniref:Uncharacterized protein n=1 Tax=Melipona quadrifasciata TaxID=166423 RepID=A0A0M9A5D4_9HYME|nr:hypothetical protein WN51_11001 [Melipona quadrifasciata]
MKMLLGNSKKILFQDGNLTNSENDSINVSATQPMSEYVSPRQAEGEKGGEEQQDFDIPLPTRRCKNRSVDERSRSQPDGDYTNFAQINFVSVKKNIDYFACDTRVPVLTALLAAKEIAMRIGSLEPYVVLKETFLPFFKRTMVPWKSFTFVMSRIQKKLHDLYPTVFVSRNWEILLVRNELTSGKSISVKNLAQKLITSLPKVIRDYGYIEQILVDNGWKCGQLGSADGILVSPEWRMILETVLPLLFVGNERKVAVRTHAVLTLFAIFHENLWFLGNVLPLYYDIVPTSSKGKESDDFIRFGHSLWSANQLPAQGVKHDGGSGHTHTDATTMINQMSVKPNAKISPNKHPRVQNHKVAVRTHALSVE